MPPNIGAPAAEVPRRRANEALDRSADEEDGDGRVGPTRVGSGVEGRGEEEDEEVDEAEGSDEVGLDAEKRKGCNVSDEGREGRKETERRT